MIALIDAELVPLWINVRTTPLPRLPIVPDVLVNARVDADHKVEDLFSRGFFLRSVVVTPDGRTLLNPSPRTIAGSLAHIATEGDLAYAEVDPRDYRSMLQHAIARFRALADAHPK